MVTQPEGEPNKGLTDRRGQPKSGANEDSTLQEIDEGKQPDIASAEIVKGEPAQPDAKTEASSS